MFLVPMIAGLVLLLLDVSMTAILLAMAVRVFRPGKEEPGPRPAEMPKYERKENPIDEGFENIMRFQVNGKTGFEREGNPWQ